MKSPVVLTTLIYGYLLCDVKEIGSNDCFGFPLKIILFYTFSCLSIWLFVFFYLNLSSNLFFSYLSIRPPVVSVFYLLSLSKVVLIALPSIYFEQGADGNVENLLGRKRY